MRQGNPPEIGGGGAYTPWVQMIHSGGGQTINGTFGVNGLLRLRSPDPSDAIYVEFFNDAGSRTGYIGDASTTDNDLYFVAEMGRSNLQGSSVITQFSNIEGGIVWRNPAGQTILSGGNDKGVYTANNTVDNGAGLASFVQMQVSNSTAPIIEMYEWDSDKRYYMVVDGGKFDIREDSTGTGPSFYIAPGFKVHTKNNQVDDGVGNALFGNPENGYVRIASSAEAVYIQGMNATQDGSKKLRLTGLFGNPGIVETYSNIVDDGSGNSTIKGILTAKGISVLDTVDGTKSLGINYKNDRGEIQAMHDGVSYKDLMLSPNGGRVLTRNIVVDDGSGGMRVNSLANGYTFETTLSIPFPNDAVDQKCDIFLGNIPLWCSLEIEGTSSFSYANANGAIRKQYVFGCLPNNQIHVNQSRWTEAMGPIVGHFSLGEIVWDATASQYKIQVAHLTGSANTIILRLKFTAIDVSDLRTSIFQGSVYTDTTSIPGPSMAVDAVLFKQGGQMGDDASATYLKANGDQFNIINEANTSYLAQISPTAAIFVAPLIGKDDAQPLSAQNKTNPNMQVNIGFDGPNGHGWIQAVNQGVAYSPLVLNPSGGAIRTPHNTLDDGNGNMVVNGSSTVNRSNDAWFVARATGDGKFVGIGTNTTGFNVSALDVNGSWVTTILQDDGNALIYRGAAVTTANQLGTLSSLQTTNKSDVVAAINELFQSASNGKSTVAAAITGMGQAASGSDTYAQLATKISAISSDATADTGHVLAGYTFYGAGVKKTGGMTNRGATNLTPSGTGTVAIPAGYHNGSGVVAQVSVPAGNVLTGTTIAGVAGTMPNHGAPTLTPGTSNQGLAAGYYSGGTVLGDPELIANNIRSGVNIFGIIGSLIEGKRSASGSINTGVGGFYDVGGLNFTPSIILAATDPAFSTKMVITYFNGYNQTFVPIGGSAGNSFFANITSSGFRINNAPTGYPMNWFAVE
jgi:hypothetical protein